MGYNRDGFIIQNSWGSDWGTAGRAVLPYEDWLDNAMDCWVAQLGVVTELHTEIANATSLSNTGDYRTNDGDIDALVTHHLDIARCTWSLDENEPVDIAIYAHGGLTSESDAAQTAAKWIAALYDAKIFPIFLMWETELMSTLKDRLEDALTGEPRLAGGWLDDAKKCLDDKWRNERLEKMLAHPGTKTWGEMKKNGAAISLAPDSGGHRSQLRRQGIVPAGLEI